MKRIWIWLTLLCCMGCVCSAGAEKLSAEPRFSGEMVRVYTSETLEFTVERFVIGKTRCYFTTLWMEEPARQIRKVTSTWRKNLRRPSELAKRLDTEAMVVINGSGYVDKRFPAIPENYPGKSPDYFYTPLGSLTVTDGEVFRVLEGVPYIGLTLENDGVHMYHGVDPEELLEKHEVIQTWSFFPQCCLIEDGMLVLEPDWKFAREENKRTILCALGEGKLGIFTVTGKTSAGMSLYAAADFLMEQVRPEWAFNLDGGPSHALLVRPESGKPLKTVSGNVCDDLDIMAFTE